MRLLSNRSFSSKNTSKCENNSIFYIIFYCHTDFLFFMFMFLNFKNVALLMATNKAAAGVTSNDMDTPLHIAAKYVLFSIKY